VEPWASTTITLRRTATLFTLPRLLWAAYVLRVVGGLVLGSGLTAALRTTDLDGQVAVAIGALVWGGTLAARQSVKRSSIWDSRRQNYRRTPLGMLAWSCIESCAWVAAGFAVAGTFLITLTLAPDLTWTVGRGIPLSVLGLALLLVAVWFISAVYAHPPELIRDSKHSMGCWICDLMITSYPRIRE
jgi:hypothetical protein